MTNPNSHDGGDQTGSFDPARIIFVASLCLMAFTYGVATMMYQLFPYGIIMNAKAAYHALKDIEEDDLFAGVMALDPKAPARPVIATLDPDVGTEHLLVTGGPYEFMQRCPKFGCMAWVIDRKGKVLHSWEVDTDALFSDLPEMAGRPLTRNLYPSGLALGADGSLVMTIQARNTFPFQIGIAKIDRNGKLLWKHWDHNHHWSTLDRAGNVYSPSMHFERNVKYFANSAIETRCNGNLDLVGINIYAPNGNLLRKLDLADIIAKSKYRGLFYGLRDGCDPIHLNSIDLASPSVAAAIPGVNPGDMLISMRKSSSVAIIDKDDGHIKKLMTGQTAGQHSPKFLPDGTALVFDNQGGDRTLGGTRIVRMNFVTGTSETIFPRPGSTREVPFFSMNAGHIDISSDGRRAMITGKEPGRSFEIDIASGQPLWSYHSSFDIAPYLERHKIKAKTTRAMQRLWGIYYVSANEFHAAGLGN